MKRHASLRSAGLRNAHRSLQMIYRRARAGDREIITAVLPPLNGRGQRRFATIFNANYCDCSSFLHVSCVSLFAGA